MTITILVPLLLTVIGVLVYALATNPKMVEIGRLTFFVGLFWLVYVFCQAKIHL